MLAHPTASTWLPRLWPFARKAEPAPVRFIVATKRENADARFKRAMAELQLGVAIVRLTDEEKAAAIARAKNGLTRVRKAKA